ncbi:MAG: hypothetical protein WC364_15175, partial [Eubacteriales bacterium]
GIHKSARRSDRLERLKFPAWQSFTLYFQDSLNLYCEILFNRNDIASKFQLKYKKPFSAKINQQDAFCPELLY